MTERCVTFIYTQYRQEWFLDYCLLLISVSLFTFIRDMISLSKLFYTLWFESSFLWLCCDVSFVPLWRLELRETELSGRKALSGERLPSCTWVGVSAVWLASKSVCPPWFFLAIFFWGVSWLSIILVCVTKIFLWTSGMWFSLSSTGSLFKPPRNS